VLEANDLAKAFGRNTVFEKVSSPWVAVSGC